MNTGAEAIKESKRAYIQEQILQEGYDKDKFKAYLESLKKDGADIDSWNLKELKTEIAYFKRYFTSYRPYLADNFSSDDNEQPEEPIEDEVLNS